MLTLGYSLNPHHEPRQARHGYGVLIFGANIAAPRDVRWAKVD